MQKDKIQITDPIERIISEALNIGPNNDETALDFKLANGVYIECKAYHTDRSADQLTRAENIILIQGKKAAETFSKLVRASRLAEIEKRVEDMATDIKNDADRNYIRYADILDKECRGFDYKIETGKITKEIIDHFASAREKFGRHQSLMDCYQSLNKLLKDIREFNGGEAQDDEKHEFDMEDALDKTEWARD